ncbi:TonB-dependent receptor [Adhaeribacter arboris]|uniref:TonB-dependent receptor n=1 Tax=Adhaeribacter arboris TaxID=2072846 RepID=A0A2T2YEU7_9BACT|nr:TonB-dependent receptor [Adhaeribacter arboris]PSR54037.1 TonB-dependent receptor [Adhaeribacter arboris]
MKHSLFKKARYLLLFFLCFIAFVEAYAQGVTLKGKITDENGAALPGVTVLLKGTSTGTATGTDGSFSLPVPNAAGTLVVSFIGYLTQEVPINNQSTFNISLASDTKALEEVVVIGYGEKEKGELTGAIANINGKNIEQTSQMNLTQALQGKIPGLVVNNRGGIPGSDDANIIIRGQSTLGNNAPLIVIDGVPRESFSHLTPNDIESISVLKDAAAAIYGARAANGVIIVKTKRGKAGQSEIRLSSNYGVSSFTSLPKYMNSYQYATWENEISERYGRAIQWTAEDLEKYRNGTSPLTHPNTDFYKEVFRDWAPQSHHNLSASGGSEKVKYYISGDYLHQDGLYKSKDLKYDQYQIRSNIDAQVTQNLNLGFDLTGRLEEQHSTATDVTSMMPFIANWAYPYNTAYYPNGLPGVGGPQGQNPVIISSDEAGWVENKNKIFQSRLSLNYNLDWLTKGLALNSYAAFDFDIRSREVFNNIWTVYDYNETTGEYVPQGGQNQSVGNTRTLNQANDMNQSQLYHARLAYNRNFGKHNYSGFIAYEQQVGTWQTLSGFRRDLISDQKVELFTGGQALRDNQGSSSETGRVNYFGSFSYDYMRKYLLDITVRRDGSFNFPRGKRFGTFPGVAVAWNISQESFMGFTKKWLDNLKLRASWAKMGNDRIGAFQYLTQYELNNYYIFGESPRRENGFTITNTGNPNITWEVSENRNMGLDADLWRGGLSISVDYFKSKRSQILITRSESVPEYTALELPLENLGEVDNEGVEVALNHQGNVGELKYNLGGNLTYNKNKIVFMDEPKDVPPYRAQEGHPLNSWVVYKTDGLYRSEDEITNSPHIPGTKPGDIKYVDVNGDGQINGNDQVRKYTSPIPRIQYGFNVGMAYKAFELNAVFSGQAKAETMLLFLDGGNKPEYLFNDRWTENNVDAKYPRAYQRTDIYNTKASDFWLYDASFLRLNNVELAYNLPSNVLSRIKVKGLRLYVRGANLITFKKIEGQFDPEINTSNAGYYPQQTTIMSGLNLSF